MVTWELLRRDKQRDVHVRSTVAALLFIWEVEEIPIFNLLRATIIFAASFFIFLLLRSLGTRDCFPHS